MRSVWERRDASISHQSSVVEAHTSPHTFQLKSVAVIAGLLAAWYMSNILYNIYNKQVRRVRGVDVGSEWRGDA